jgi:hypothetical protein
MRSASIRTPFQRRDNTAGRSHDVARAQDDADLGQLEVEVGIGHEAMRGDWVRLRSTTWNDSGRWIV